MKEQNRVNRCLIFTANPGHFYQRQTTPQRLSSCPPHPVPLQTTRSAKEDRQQLPPPTGVAQDLPPMVCWPGRQQDHRHQVTQHTPFLSSFGTPRVKEETSLSGPVGNTGGNRRLWLNPQTTSIFALFFPAQVLKGPCLRRQQRQSLLSKQSLSPGISHGHR